MILVITFRLNTKPGLPLYLQIIEQVKHAVHTGTLKEGDQLPTIKEVIGMIAINPNTVARAYRELEKEGYVKGRAGVGTIVLHPPSGHTKEVPQQVRDTLATFLTEAAAAGLEAEIIEALVQTELRKRNG